MSASSFPLRPSLPVGTVAYIAASFAIPWVFLCPFSLHRNDSGDDKQVIRRDSRGNCPFPLGEWVLRRQNYPCWASCTRQRDAQHEPSSRCSLLARAFFNLCHMPVTTSGQNTDVFTYLLQIARASPPSARAFPCTVSHIDRYGPRCPRPPMSRYDGLLICAAFPTPTIQMHTRRPQQLRFRYPNSQAYTYGSVHHSAFDAIVAASTLATTGRRYCR